MNIRRTNLARLIIAVLMLCLGSNVVGAQETNIGSAASEEQVQSKEPGVKIEVDQVIGTKSPPKPVAKNKVASPENFIPTEDISRDLSVSFPVDI